MKTIEEYAKLGEHHDVLDALILLTRAYISMCGFSLGYRTVVYDAAESWQERLAWMDLPLSEIARKEALVSMMPHITSDYNPEIYDEYDITGMSQEELMDCCKQIVAEETFDEATTEVLCWGVLKTIESFGPFQWKEIEVTAPEGTLLKGFLTDQDTWETSIQMQQPYPNVCLTANELVRDARELLLRGYDDYRRLQSLESDIRALYPKYQEELEKRKNESAYRKSHVFDDVYGPLIGETVLLMPEQLIHEWFGLDFFRRI